MFPKIGTFDIVTEGDVIHVRSDPQFNLEAVQEYAVRMSQVIAHMEPGFGVLAEFVAPPIMGPEVETAMRETAAQRARQGMRGVAFVTPEQHGMTIAREQWKRVYDPAGVPFAFFEDVDSARRWLRAKIDSA